MHALLTNEFGFGEQYALNYAQDPAGTQQAVNHIRNTMYKPGPSGLSDNDDLGANSSAFVWEMLGTYPENSGSDNLVFNGPGFPHIGINLPNGKTVTINAPGASPAGGVLVDVEVFVNARYGYDVRCELVGEDGTVSLDAAAPTVLRHSAEVGSVLPGDWRPRFAEAYRRELQDWVDGLRVDKVPGGASAWDGYAATAVARAGVAALETGVRQLVKVDGKR